MKEDHYIEGKCLQMCPQSEADMRIKENLLHDLEKTHNRLVKCFKRSAAGVETCEPSILRPPHVLEDTIVFLFNKILVDQSKPFHIVYHFVEDRLKAVRQDLFIQQPSPDACFPILEPIVRFYAYSAYRLAESPLKDFDPVLNHNQLLETFKWLLKLYDTWNQVSPERIEMEALYALFNLGEPSSLFRTVNLPSRIRHDLVLLAEQMSVAWYLGNYAKVCKVMLHLPVLLSALTYAVQQPYVKKHALRVMCSAYSSKTLSVPLAVIQKQLLFNTEGEVEDFLSSCGLEILRTETKAVKFSKNNKISENLPTSTKLDFIDLQIKKQYLPDLLLNSPVNA